jgi:hypothetical protein
MMRNPVTATRIGILSDSHGRVDTTRAAIALLLQAGCTTLLHLGDIGSDEVLDEFVGLQADVHIVLGNCDGDDLGRYAGHIGLHNDHPAGLLEIDGRHIAFTHGHLEDHLRKALKDGVDYLLHGHSHELRDETIGRTRVINPGALQRAARYTAAALEPATGRLNILEVPRR